MSTLHFFYFFVDVLPPSFAVIPYLFYFSILVHFVYSHVAIQVFYFWNCLDIEDACFDCYCIIWCWLWYLEDSFYDVVHDCIFWLSLCVVVLLSAPYVIIGMMHVSTSFHIIAIFSPSKFVSFAMWSIVWYAASTFPSSIFTWSSRFPLLLIILSMYLYLSVSSISMSPSFSSVWTLLPIFITLLFSFPNTMRYLLDISFVMSSIFCISWALLLIRTTSSMYSRHPNLGCDVLFVFTPFFIVAVRLVFMSFVICQFSVSIRLLLSTYGSASSHALSYAFVTSRYTIYRGFFLFFCVAKLSFSIVRWSVVDLHSLPPTCASDIFIWGRVRLSIIRSYTFPMLSSCCQVVVNYHNEN